jgi:hypothetical protein
MNAKQVRGFLAADGKFFDTEAECRRHEFAQTIVTSCESHGINPENFFMLLREWHEQIKGYYDADSKCKTPAAVPTGTVSFANDLSQSEDDNEDAPVGDKDAPAFLQQSLRRNI